MSSTYESPWPNDDLPRHHFATAPAPDADTRFDQINAKLNAILECLTCPQCKGQGYYYHERYSETIGIYVGAMAMCECRKNAVRLIHEAQAHI